jgi:2-keto-4-pentenoate hydratase/2-oxohepta-3-ene-1,7-dioic acid hydratase in catechol pathway
MAPTGPVVASPDRVPADASIELRIDGEVRQQSDRSRYIFGLPEIIEEITTYFTLEPGDVVPMGSPPGPAPLSDGDHVEVEVEGVGTLEHDVHIP